MKQLLDERGEHPLTTDILTADHYTYDHETNTYKLHFRTARYSFDEWARLDKGETFYYTSISNVITTIGEYAKKRDRTQDHYESYCLEIFHEMNMTGKYDDCGAMLQLLPDN